MPAKIFIIILLIVYQLPLFSQADAHIDCRVLSGGSSLNSQGQVTCFDYNTDYENAPILTIYVNIHIFNTTPAVSNAILVQRARDFIRFSNETLDNMQQNYRNGPGGVPAPRVEDAKYRLKLYSHPDSLQDVNGGIWVYPAVLMFPQSVGDDITTVSDNATQFPGYSRRYGNNAIDILLVNIGAKVNNMPPPTFNANTTGYVRGRGGNFVIMADLNGAFQADALNGTTNPNDLIWRSIARALNHEIAHILSLNHTFECGYTECADVDVVAECGSTCSATNPCGGANNRTDCPGTTRAICTYGHSWNIMAYDWFQHSITRCQWGRIYNYAINTTFAPIRDCATSTTQTLTTSPLADYRASQQITSTSVIGTGRDVTYQSSLIRLNPGFRVALGAAFLASPSTFPCCDPPPASIAPPGENELTLKNNEENNNDFQVFPNPFENEITIRFQKNNAFSNQKQTQLDIIDVNGKIVHSAIINTSDETKISTKNFAPGLYMVRLSVKNLQKTYQIIKI